MSKTDIWNRLGKTDPEHTKAFQRAGGFRGTAMKPIWIVKRMTEEFGPCGKGWGIGKPEFQVEHSPDVTAVYCTVSVWWEKPEQVIYGVGGDQVRKQMKDREFVDDEAFKKAFTDAVNNALKYLGIGADIHMGQFDDSKYVAEVGREFEAAKSSAELKRNGVWQEFQNDLADVSSLVTLDKFRADMRERAKAEGWNKTFMEAAKDAIEGKVQELTDLENAKVVTA